MTKDIETKEPVTKVNKKTGERITKIDDGCYSVVTVVSGRVKEILVKPNHRNGNRNPNPEGIKIVAKKMGMTVEEYLESVTPVEVKIKKSGKGK
jgi:hypothetical protein